MTTQTDSFNFTLILDGGVISDDVLDRLFQAGLDDGTFGQIDGTSIAEFDRAASGLREAVTSAIEDIEHAAPEIRVVSVSADQPLARPRRGCLSWLWLA
jgi:hypothetical protein